MRRCTFPYRPRLHTAWEWRPSLTWDRSRNPSSATALASAIACCASSTSGSPPNRIFNVEWRAAYFATGLPVNFEIRLYEGQPRFDLGGLLKPNVSTIVGAAP